MDVANYTSEDWQRLGQAIRTARTRCGYERASDWATAVGRSGRLLLGLERGEPAGDTTLRVIEEVLRWPYRTTDQILAKEPPGNSSHSFSEWLSFIVQPDPTVVHRWVSTRAQSLHEASDEDLLAEVARRLAERDGIGGLDEGGEVDAGQAEAQKSDQVGDRSGTDGQSETGGALAAPGQKEGRRVVKGRGGMDRSHRS